MDREVIYLGHDNDVALILKENNTAVDLSGVTKMTLSFATVMIESTNDTSEPLTWAKSGYQTGEMRIALGTATNIRANNYDAVLVVYDTTFTNGIVWGNVKLAVRDEVEGAT